MFCYDFIGAYTEVIIKEKKEQLLEEEPKRPEFGISIQGIHFALRYHCSELQHRLAPLVMARFSVTIIRRTCKSAQVCLLGNLHRTLIASSLAWQGLPPLSPFRPTPILKLLKALNLGINHSDYLTVQDCIVIVGLRHSRLQLFDLVTKRIDICVFLFVCLLECFDCSAKLLNLCCEDGGLVVWS